MNKYLKYKLKYLKLKHSGGASVQIIPRIAIDCGGVLSLTDTDATGDNLSEKVTNTIMTQECLQAVALLVKQFGVENTFIISKCKTKMQLATLVMLSRNNFYKKTNFKPENVYFCTHRSGGQFQNFTNLEKAKVAQGIKVGKGEVAKQLKITHMIDDKMECLESILNEGYLNQIKEWLTQNNKPVLFLFKPKYPPDKMIKFSVLCDNWNDILIHNQK